MTTRTENDKGWVRPPLKPKLHSTISMELNGVWCEVEYRVHGIDKCIDILQVRDAETIRYMVTEEEEDHIRWKIYTEGKA